MSRSRCFPGETQKKILIKSEKYHVSFVIEPKSFWTRDVLGTGFAGLRKRVGDGGGLGRKGLGEFGLDRPVQVTV